MSMLKLPARASGERRPGIRSALRSGSVSMPLLACVVLGSAAVGMIDAAVLAAIVQIAVSMTRGSSSAALETGPFTVEASTPTLLAVAGVLLAIQIVAQVLLSWGPARMAAQAQLVFRRRIVAAFSGAAWPTKAQERDGSLQEVMTNHADLAAQSLLNLTVAMSSLVTLAALVVSSFAVDPLAAAAVITAGGLIFALLLPVTLRMHRAAQVFADRRLDMAESVSETVALAEDTHAYGVGAEQAQRLDGAIARITGPFFRLRLLGRAIPAAYQTLVLALIIGGLALLHAFEVSDIAGLGAIIVMLLRGLNYGQKFQTAHTRWNEQSFFVQRIDDTILEWQAHPEARGVKDVRTIQTLELVDVGFAYGNRDAKVLHQISLSAQRGEVLGVVGPSGAGKSTLLKILLDLYPADEGLYLINGKPPQAYSTTLRHAIGYVPQQGRLLSGTVEENIQFLRDVPRTAVIEAAKAANIHDEICAWEQQYDTFISPRSSGISGGQAQRLMLARALVQHPSLLLLDEPTSSLDTRSEKLIQDTIARIKSTGDTIVVIVAHRLTALLHCDRIAVVHGGTIEAIASPDMLQHSNGFFRQLVSDSAHLGPDRSVPSPAMP